MDFLEVTEHIISHSIADTLYLIPFLYATYLLMEWLEHKGGAASLRAIERAGTAGPVIGGILGVVPQCGFSASAATLYAARVVTVGTLIAVLLSTSDEMLPIFIAQSVPVQTIASILLFKVFVGILFGVAIDFVLRNTNKQEANYRIHELCADANCGCRRNCNTCKKHPELAYEHVDDCKSGCCHTHHEHDHDHDKNFGWKQIFKSAFVHTLQVVVFVFVITLILNVALETFGEEALANALGGDTPLAIVACALVGLIPNCAASLVVAELYAEGILGPGAMISGLLVSAGIGFLVLVRTNKHQLQNAYIIGSVFLISVFCGFIVALSGFNFFFSI